MNPNKPSSLDFFEFIYDRQKIWYNRFVLNLSRRKQNWTLDPVLQKFSFCNVYRELDKCTRHLMVHILRGRELSIEDKIFNTILYRRFNTFDFFAVFGVQDSNTFHWKSLIRRMDDRSSLGHNLFNSAYIISQTPYDRSFGRREKHVQQVLVLKDLSAHIENLTEKLLHSNYEKAFEVLKGIYGHGGFLAQQVLIDLSYLPEFKNWKINSFVQVGPGAKPALELLFPSVKGWNDQKYSEYCATLGAFEVQGLSFLQLKEERKKDWNKIYYKDSIAGGKYLRLSDIQNCLCEFRKYCHLQTNPNKRKRYYKGAV